MEVWKDIKDYEGSYKISNWGRVKSLPKTKRKKEKILSINKNRHGYCYIFLYKNSKRKYYQIHRLVATAFIPNNYNKSEVNHIDGNKTNNNINNLEWVTKSENKIHAYSLGLCPVTEKQRIARRKNLAEWSKGNSFASSAKNGGSIPPSANIVEEVVGRIY